MKIHRYDIADTTELIATKHGITNEMLCIYNNIGNSAPAHGEELIILTPTRTYKTRINDTYLKFVWIPYRHLRRYPS